MNPASFEEQNMIFAKDQPEYNALPAYRTDDRKRIVCCWKLSWRERLMVLCTGRVWHQVMTFDRPLQPQLLTVEKPDMGDA